MYNNITCSNTGNTFNIQTVNGKNLLYKYIYHHNLKLLTPILNNMMGGRRKGLLTESTIEDYLNSIKTEQTGKILDIQLLKNIYNKLENYIKKLRPEEVGIFMNWVTKKISEHPTEETTVDNLTVLVDAFVKGEKKKTTFNTESGLKHNIKILKYSDRKKCLGKYKIIKTLGSGAFGTTYEVVKGAKKGGKRYAMKQQIIPKEGVVGVGENATSLPQLRLNEISKEIRIATLMGKHNIGPKVYDSYLCDDNNEMKVFIIMDIMNSGNLQEFSEKNLVDEKFIQKLKAKIKQMHNLNIMHQDLHAGNVFVHIKNNIPIPFLGDFGMSDTFGDAIRHAADGETNLWWVTNFSSDTNKVIIQTMIIMGVFF